MTALDYAADNLLDVTLRLFARGIHPTRNAEALDNMRDILVSEFRVTPVVAVDAVRAAMLRRAAQSTRPELQRIAALYHTKG